MSAKAKKEEKAEVTVTVSDVMQEKGKQSATNIKNGNEAVKVSLTRKVKVRFTKDYGFIKKDATLQVSELAYDIYAKAGVVEKI